MAINDNNTYLRAAAIGAIAGMRSMAPLALLSRQAEKSNQAVPILDDPTLATLLRGLAASEMLGGQMPFTSKRTDKAALLARGGTGALAGATICAMNDAKPITGALIGGLSAIAAAYASYHLRHYLTENLNLPDRIVALLEDSVVMQGGQRVVEGVFGSQPITTS